MTLADNPDWKKYLCVCKDKNQKPSLNGFIRWKIYSDSNGERWKTAKQKENMILVS